MTRIGVFFETTELDDLVVSLAWMRSTVTQPTTNLNLKHRDRDGGLYDRPCVLVVQPLARVPQS